ncbi:NAD(P)H-dependent flavin oxidoreductase [Corynebacterium pacaense]|uniref:NAD(P)H-dependent flavin oxidoreductase n=1 Tax=Corynebacterium pacaense TaxID=1816684 RepID=UPI0009B94EA1|nr:nitronate monooxygenase [Corynebacterium pacaense]
MTILDSLDIPVIIAPMAGGPSTPALVNAAHESGTVGFLAGGVIGVDQLREDISGVNGRFGVNLFRPQDREPAPADIDAVAGRLTQAFREYGLDDPHIPEVDLSNGWAEKFDLLLQARPAVVSSTFGMFTATEFDALNRAGIEAWVTVTNPEDAVTAEAAGADVLIVQGPEAGGHRSTWSIDVRPDRRSLDDLLRDIAVSVPIVAAGGISTSRDVERVLSLGAQAASCGTAFLLAPEAGTSLFNRGIIADGGPTVSTRAFSGRFARGAATAFSRANESLPPLYPYLNTLLAPLRKASTARGNRDFAYCLAGTGMALAREAEAKRILMELNPSA